eukprot:COSAG01_NODE_22570_length_850_cov_1.223702_2_plen_154_part_00
MPPPIASVVRPVVSFLLLLGANPRAMPPRAHRRSPSHRHRHYIRKIYQLQLRPRPGRLLHHSRSRGHHHSSVAQQTKTLEWLAPVLKFDPYEVDQIRYKNGIWEARFCIYAFMGADAWSELACAAGIGTAGVTCSTPYCSSHHLPPSRSPSRM